MSSTPTPKAKQRLPGTAVRYRLDGIVYRQRTLGVGLWSVWVQEVQVLGTWRVCLNVSLPTQYRPAEALCPRCGYLYSHMAEQHWRRACCECQVEAVEEARARLEAQGINLGGRTVAADYEREAYGMREVRVAWLRK